MPRTRHFRFPSKQGALDSKAGLLTCRSSRRRLPSHSSWNSGLAAGPLSAYSGGTVRDFHPLPFSLILYDEYLERVINTILAL